jgi:DnaJ-class molecular chaperone
VSAPVCVGCEGEGWVIGWGHTSAPVASPPEVKVECGDCDGEGIDWSQTCENCGDAPSATVNDDTRYCVTCAKEV